MHLLLLAYSGNSSSVSTATTTAATTAAETAPTAATKAIATSAASAAPYVASSLAHFWPRYYNQPSWPPYFHPPAFRVFAPWPYHLVSSYPTDPDNDVIAATLKQGVERQHRDVTNEKSFLAEMSKMASNVGNTTSNETSNDTLEGREIDAGVVVDVEGRGRKVEGKFNVLHLTRQPTVKSTNHKKRSQSGASPLTWVRIPRETIFSLRRDIGVRKNPSIAV